MCKVKMNHDEKILTVISDDGIVEDRVLRKSIIQLRQE